MKMKYTENAINILTAKNYKGIGRAWIIKHFKGNEKVDAIVSLINKYSKEEYPVAIEEFEKNKERIELDKKKALEKYNKMEIQFKQANDIFKKLN